jgi:putative transposase
MGDPGRTRLAEGCHWWQHLLRSARYVLLNPVRAGLVDSSIDWPYSSARFHATGLSDGIVNLEPLAARVSDWEEFLAEDVGAEERKRLRLHQRTGRPLGSDEFLRRLGNPPRESHSGS